jgi:aminoglycoside phosphotransferase (APT) family kinase protein
VSKKSNNKHHNPYQKYLEEKHRKLITPDSVINKVVKKATGSSLKMKNRIIEGEVNEVYEVVTEDKQSVIVRISRSKHPRFEAEEKAIKLALMAGVPAPKVILVERVFEKKDSITVCVEEKIDGKPLKKLMGKLDEPTLKSIISEAGNILSKIHSVKLEGFGELGRDIPYRDWGEYVLRSERKLDRIIEASKNIGIEVSMIKKAIEILKSHSSVYSKIKPYLLHGDFSTKHFLIRNNNIVGIIDFENAKGGDPVLDFAWLNYFYGKVIPTNWLKDGYTNKNVFYDNFKLKMKLYRLHLSLGFIDYYEYEKNEAGINHTKKMLVEELNNF